MIFYAWPLQPLVSAGRLRRIGIDYAMLYLRPDCDDACGLSVQAPGRPGRCAVVGQKFGLAAAATPASSGQRNCASGAGLGFLQCGNRAGKEKGCLRV